MAWMNNPAALLTVVVCCGAPRSMAPGGSVALSLHTNGDSFLSALCFALTGNLRNHPRNVTPDRQSLHPS